METPWTLVFLIFGSFAGMFYLTRKALLVRVEEHETKAIITEAQTVTGQEIEQIVLAVWYRLPLEGDDYALFKQWGADRVENRLRDEVTTWMLEKIGEMSLLEAKPGVAKLARRQEGLQIGQLPIYPRVRIVIEKINLKDADARALSAKAIETLRAEGVMEAMRILQEAGLSPRHAATTISAVKAVAEGQQVGLLMQKLIDLASTREGGESG